MNFFFFLSYLFRDAWDKCRTMTKEQAMSAYIDEIRKVNIFDKRTRERKLFGFDF